MVRTGVLRNGTDLPAATDGEVSGLRFTGSGIDYSVPATVNAFSGRAAAYALSSGTGSLTADGVSLAAAAIDVPGGYGKLNFTGIPLSYDGYSAEGYGVAGTSSWSGTHTFTPGAYKNAVTIKSAGFSAAGLIANTVSVTLPSSLGGTSSDFSALPLPANGAFGQTAPRENLSFTASGFACSGNGPVFNGSDISFPGGITVTAKTLSPTGASSSVPVLFTGLVIKDTGLVGTGSSSAVLGSWDDGWRYGFRSLTFTSAGFFATADLLNQNLSVYENDKTTLKILSLASTELVSDGTVVPGSLNVPFVLRAAGNAFAVESALLIGNKLRITDARLLLPLNASAASAQIRNIALSSDGVMSESEAFSVDSFSLRFYEGLSTESYLDLVPMNTESIGFENGSLVITNAQTRSGSGIPSATYFLARNIRVSESGIDYGDAPLISSFSGVAGGYGFSAGVGTLAEGKVMLSALTVTLPSAYGSGSKPFSGSLELSFDGFGTAGYRIAGSCTWSSGGGTPLSFIPSNADSSRYKGQVNLTELSIRSDGLVADEFFIVLPAALGGTTAVFNALPLPPSGVFGLSATKDTLSFRLTGANFPVTGYGALFDGNVIRFSSVEVGLGGSASPEALETTGLTIDGNGLGTIGTATTAVTVDVSGWNFLVSDVSVSTSGISGSGSLRLPAAFGSREVGFPGFVFSAPGAVLPGTSSSGAFIRTHGWKTELSSLSLVNGNIKADSAKVRLYSSMGGEELEIPNLVLSPTGAIVSSGEGSVQKEFLAENGFLVRASHYKITAQNIVCAGKVFFPQGLGEDSAGTYSLGEIILNPDGSVVTPARSTPVNYKVGGFNVEARDYEFTREGLRIGASSIHTGFLGQPLEFTFPEIEFYADGAIRTGGTLLEGFEIPFGGLSFGVSSVRLTDRGINLSSFINLPANLGGSSIYFDKLTLGADGKVTTDAAVSEYSFSFKGFDFLFRNIRFDPDAGFMLGEALITLPEAMESKRIRLVNLSIGADGSFNLGGLSVDPFEMFGFTFSLNDLSFTEGTLALEGAIRLPDRFPDPIAGKSIEIADFSYSFTQNKVVSFLVEVNDPLSFPLSGDEWVVTAEGISIGMDANGKYLFGIDSGTLEFPENFNEDIAVKSIGIADIKIDPQSGSFSFDSVTIDDLEITKFGCEFAFDEISITQDLDFSLCGTVTLPGTQNVPELLRSKVITVSRFEIVDGKLGEIAASLSGLSGKLHDELYLEEGTVSFTKTAAEYSLGIDNAVLRLGSSFPEGIANQHLTLEKFRFSLADYTISTLNAKSSPLCLQPFRQGGCFKRLLLDFSQRADRALHSRGERSEDSFRQSGISRTCPFFGSGNYAVLDRLERDASIA